MNILIGRSAEADIVIDDNTVSRQHAELNHIRDNNFYIIDLESKNGIFVFENEQWVQKSQADVFGDTYIALGAYVTTPNQLLLLINPPVEEKKQSINEISADNSGSKPRRNPLTGEVIF